MGGELQKDAKTGHVENILVVARREEDMEIDDEGGSSV